MATYKIRIINQTESDSTILEEYENEFNSSRILDLAKDESFDSLIVEVTADTINNADNKIVFSFTNTLPYSIESNALDLITFKKTLDSMRLLIGQIESNSIYHITDKSNVALIDGLPTTQLHIFDINNFGLLPLTIQKNNVTDKTAVVQSPVISLIEVGDALEAGEPILALKNFIGSIAIIPKVYNGTVVNELFIQQANGKKATYLITTKTV